MPTQVATLPPSCVPGQLGTKAYCRAPVVLVSVDGQFGTGGTITLTSNHNPGSPGSMGVVAGVVWTAYAIAATFPSSNPGDGLAGETFTIKVHPTGGDAVEISEVIVFGLPVVDPGWPPTM